MKPVVGITCGDPAGIGAEVIAKALSRPAIGAHAKYVVIGFPELFDRSILRTSDVAELSAATQHECWNDGISFVRPAMATPDRMVSGEPSKMSGMVAGKALDAAVRLLRERQIDGIVTAPISKHALNQAGYSFPGHTEFLAQEFRAPDVTMMMVNGDFRVGLVTTHCSLASVASTITQTMILRKLGTMNADLQQRFGVERPSIAVCALNPHAGENGMFGLEEIETISPAVNRARQEGIDAHGPFPADALFALAKESQYDAYLAMYHDQGLIPAKMNSFTHTVNYTAGLPVVRTSPDHGTAFDIAGKGVADPTSMEEAIQLAVALASRK